METSKNVCILIIAQLLSKKLVPVCAPTSYPREQLLPHALHAAAHSLALYLC